MKIVKSPYISEKLSDFNEIWYTTSDIEPSYSHVTKKNEFFFGIQDGGGRHLEIRFFGHNSSTDSSFDFSEILYEKAKRHADKGYGTKNVNV